MLRLYIIGLSILLIAIIANFLANKLGLKTWYDFMEILFNTTSTGIKSVGVVDYLWLFLFYPLILGLGYLLGLKLYIAVFD
ncbi:MAG: hypothetical protein HKN00_07375 [Flavobacteriaceae bacterium]|nr:hypothetical protein [Bacteroidia bacterium]MBT8289068.1 hypothetical protein [Bacteroidia bacterium]NNF74987.1 hypothetical protein [Flavobacteriaceae bacterium]NNK71711.1 hypothetical protein [Flavobacteriaceae bacterium]